MKRLLTICCVVVGFVLALSAVAQEPTDDETLPVLIDIKPGSCPNPLSVKSKGLLSVAIVDTETLDVYDVNADSITLQGVPFVTSYLGADSDHDDSDRASSWVPENVCDCTAGAGDGRDDLVLKFDKQAILTAIELAIEREVEDDDEVVLTLTGVLLDGTPIVGQDCVVIRKRGKQ